MVPEFNLDNTNSMISQVQQPAWAHQQPSAVGDATLVLAVCKASKLPLDNIVLAMTNSHGYNMHLLEENWYSLHNL